MNILINSSTLAKLIEAEPKISIDILNSAIPQIAQYITKKFTEQKVMDKVDSHIRDVLDKVRYGSMTVAQREGFKKIIQEIWSSDMKDRLEIEARRVAEEIAGQKIAQMLDDVRAELREAQEAARAEIDTYARGAAEREVLALLRGGQLVIKES